MEGRGNYALANWRLQLVPESRSRVVNKIFVTLKKHLPVSGPEDPDELKMMAVQFEEKVFSVATSQADYLRKISMKMLSLEQSAHGKGSANGLPTNSSVKNPSCSSGCNGCSRPLQADPIVNPNATASTEWRSQIQMVARLRIVTKIMDTLKKHWPTSRAEDLDKLQQFAVQFEKNIFYSAVSQGDYLRKISVQMLSMEHKTRGNGTANVLPTNIGIANDSSPEAGKML